VRRVTMAWDLSAVRREPVVIAVLPLSGPESPRSIP
jgi:hypothetical protein